VARGGGPARPVRHALRPARRGDRARGLVARGPGDRDRGGGRAVGRTLAPGLPDEPTDFVLYDPAWARRRPAPRASTSRSPRAPSSLRTRAPCLAPAPQLAVPGLRHDIAGLPGPAEVPHPSELPGDRELLASPTRCGKLGS
jgi:hypothetical protein